MTTTTAPTLRQIRATFKAVLAAETRETEARIWEVICQMIAPGSPEEREAHAIYLEARQLRGELQDHYISGWNARSHLTADQLQELDHR